MVSMLALRRNKQGLGLCLAALGFAFSIAKIAIFCVSGDFFLS